MTTTRRTRKNLVKRTAARIERAAQQRPTPSDADELFAPIPILLNATRSVCLLDARGLIRRRLYDRPEARGRVYMPAFPAGIRFKSPKSRIAARTSAADP